jgi:glycosyltransferase involved in cell wall biosynthesis
MTLDFPCPQTPRVSVVIVAKSKLDLLHACLQSVARFAPSAIPFETIVVLNEAGPDAEAELRAMATAVTVARSPVNLGFAGAGNRARSLARDEFLLLLHDDAEVQAGWMEALVQTADSPSAIARAMARAEVFAEECRRRGPPALVPPATRAAFDPTVHELRAYERNRVFQNAYVGHLVETLERAEEQFRQTTAERDALLPQATRCLDHRAGG